MRKKIKVEFNQFIIGVVVGTLFGSAVVGMTALAGSRQTREYDKFVESAAGDTAVRIVIVE